MGLGESSLESTEYYCIFWGKKKSVEDKEWPVGAILGIDVGDASALLYQNVKTQRSCPHFFHFKCKMLDMGTLLHAGKDKDAVEFTETRSYIGKGERWREGVVRKFEMDTYMLLYLKWITNKDQLYSTLYLLNVCGSLHGRGVWKRMDTCICMAKSICCPPETITTLFIGYAPI